MASFRFCRPDDVEELVDAVNRTYLVHFPGLAPMTVEAFKREIKELNLWTSSCMLATEDSGPVAVLIAAKRRRSSVILRLGVHPGFQRLGYGSHLLDSLQSKMHVLGPPLLTVELEERDAEYCRFFEKQGHQKLGRFTDFELKGNLEQPELTELISEINIGDLEDRYLIGEEGEELDVDEALPWIRQTETLRNRMEEMRGFGIPDLDGIAAYVFARDASEENKRFVDVCALGCRDGKKTPLYMSILLRYVSKTFERGVRIPRLSEREIPYEIVEDLGFEKRRGYFLYGVRTQ